MKYAYMHSQCGKVAFYIDHMPEPGNIVRAKDFTMLDGSAIASCTAPCTPFVCGSCGKKIRYLSYNDVKPHEGD